MLKFPWPRKKSEGMSAAAAEHSLQKADTVEGTDFFATYGQPALAEARRLASQPSEDAAPYKDLYAAADVLLQCQRQAEAHVSSAAAASDPALSALIAELSVRRGLYLAKTELLSDAEAAIMAGMPALEAALPNLALLLLRANNALALLLGERDEPQAALERLETAERIFRQHLAPQAAPQEQHAALPPAASAGESGSTRVPTTAEAAGGAVPGQAGAAQEGMQAAREAGATVRHSSEPEAATAVIEAVAGTLQAAAPLPAAREGGTAKNAPGGKPPASQPPAAGEEAGGDASGQGGADVEGAQASEEAGVGGEGWKAAAADVAAAPASAAEQAHTLTLFYLAQVRVGGGTPSSC